MMVLIGHVYLLIKDKAWAQQSIVISLDLGMENVKSGALFKLFISLSVDPSLKSSEVFLIHRSNDYKFCRDM